MADNNDPTKWRRLPKPSFNSKDLSRRMKKSRGTDRLGLNVGHLETPCRAEHDRVQ